MTVDLLIRDVRLRDGESPIEIAVDDGHIAALGTDLGLESAQVVEGCGDLVLPGFVCAHVHLDKTGMSPELRPPTWDGDKRRLRAVNARIRGEATVESIIQRATPTIESAIRHGTTTLRGFADVAPDAGLTGVRALVALRELYSREIRIEVCGFPQALISPHPGMERLLEEALEVGADVVGAMPSEEPTLELMQRHIDFCFDLAQRHDRDIHLLIDDSDDPSHRALEYAAWRTVRAGWEGRVIAGHAGALASYDNAHAASVIGRVADAGIAVCVNAHVSLVLQGRQDRGPIRRGATRVKELLAAGVNVLAAQDDMNDPYYSLGRGDALEVAHYAAHVCHLMWPAELEVVRDFVTVNAARAMRLEGYGLNVGCRADLVISGRPTLRELLADLPPRRAVVGQGRLLAQAEVVSRRYRP
jgi:cytosine deaminase